MTELVSATTLIKDALGTSRGSSTRAGNTIAGAAFDKLQDPARVRGGRRPGGGGQVAAATSEWERTGGRLRPAAPTSTGWPRRSTWATVLEFDAAIEPFVQQYRRFLEDFEPRVPDGRGARVQSHVQVRRDARRHARSSTARRYVVDIKTTAHGPNAKDSRGKPKSRPPFPEVALQLTLYRRAELVGLLGRAQGDPVPPVLRVRPAGARRADARDGRRGVRGRIAGGLHGRPGRYVASASGRCVGT